MESSIVLKPFYNLDEADLACAQDPLCELYSDMHAEQKQSSRLKAKRTPKRRERKMRCLRRQSDARASSYVINREVGKGRRVIKIEIIDMETPNSDSDAEEGHILVSAQYTVKEPVDEIMDQTETLVHNISKKLCGYSFYAF